MGIMSLHPIMDIWKDESVYILGGGPSLKTFISERGLDFFVTRKVIGCNDAYIFGTGVVDFVCFGDCKWWAVHKDKVLPKYKDHVITGNPNVDPMEGLMIFERRPSGFHKKALGWNGNTGALAINAALIMGASKIYLLGFDMAFGANGETNWHNCNVGKVKKEHLERHASAITRNVGHIRVKWPLVNVYNVNEQDNLHCFPLLDFKSLI